MIRNIYQALSCLIREKSPWVVSLHGQSINCRAIRFVDCGGMECHRLTRFDDLVSLPGVLRRLWRSHPLFVHAYLGAVLIKTLYPAGTRG